MPTPKQLINPRQTWGQKARQRIDSTRHINTLERIASGDEEGTQVQLHAIKMLLDRTMPTIKPIEVKVDGDQNAKSITNTMLLDAIESTATRVDK